MDAPKRDCPKCHIPRDENDFLRRSGSGGHRKQRWCRFCCSAAVRKVYSESLDYRESHKVAQRRRRIENLRFILEHLVTHPCVDCCEADLLVLQFDHIDFNEKRDVMGMLLNSRDRIAAEIAKCVVRCANCHAKRTAEQFNTTRFKLVQEIKAGKVVPSQAPRPYAVSRQSASGLFCA
jgi:hypothetical protein